MPQCSWIVNRAAGISTLRIWMWNDEQHKENLDLLISTFLPMLSGALRQLRFAPDLSLMLYGAAYILLRDVKQLYQAQHSYATNVWVKLWPLRTTLPAHAGLV